MKNKKREEVKNRGAENSGLEEKAVEGETERREEVPIEVEKVKEETSREFEEPGHLCGSPIPSGITEYALQNVFSAPLASGVFNALVHNAYQDNFLSRDGLTVQVLENQFDQNGRGTILYALQYLMDLNIAIEGKADEYGKRYYQLQKDFTLWKPSREAERGE